MHPVRGPAEVVDVEEPPAAVGDRVAGSSGVVFFGLTHTGSHGRATHHKGGRMSELLYEAQAREGAAHTSAYVVSSKWRTLAPELGRVDAEGRDRLGAQLPASRHTMRVLSEAAVIYREVLSLSFGGRCDLDPV